MHILHLDKVTINHAGRVIFRNLSWAIDSQGRVGLIGPNGAGKSSLLKAIIGEITPDVGAITRMNGVRVGYLAQEPQLVPGRTLIAVPVVYSLFDQGQRIVLRRPPESAKPKVASGS